MADPSKEVKLQSDWEAAGVGIEILKVNPAAAKNLKRKRKSSSLKPSASRQEIADEKKASESTPPAAQNTNETSLVLQSAATSATPPAENPPQAAQNAPAHAEDGPGDEELRLREEMDARLREQGFMPFVADLEALKRVYTVGLDLFRRMSENVPAEMARVLRGKITVLKIVDLPVNWEKVQAELNSLRDIRYLNLSSENRELREQSEKMQGLKEELDGARSTIASQAKQLEALPGVEAEKNKAKEAERVSREKAEALKKEVEELAAEKAEALKKADAAASAGGYQNALNLSFALAPWLHEHATFFDGKHYAKDQKVWLGDQMVYDPAMEAKEEEEERQADDGETGQ